MRWRPLKPQVWSRNGIGGEIQHLLAAVSFFTRLPVTRWTLSLELARAHAVRYFSLVGWLVAAVASMVFWVSHHWFPLEIALLLSMASSILCTGGLHEDGLADLCDAFGGAMDRDAILRILRDSRIGTFGVVGLVLVLALKFAALVQLSVALVIPALFLGHSLSRLAAASLMYALPYVGAPAGSKTKPLTRTLWRADAALLAIFGLLPLALFEPRVLWVLLPLSLICWSAAQYFRRRLGGYTGDCLGAVQQITEVVLYLGLVALQG